MMRLVFLTVFVSVLYMTSLKAQESQYKQFIVMSGYGYTHSEFVSGFANVNSFIYKYNNRWGAGLDFGTTIGSSVDKYSINTSGEKKINSLSIGPNIYYFLANTSKHLAYINVGVNYTHKQITSLQNNFIQNKPSQYWFSENESVFGFNLSTGYSYKLTDGLSIGARVYCNHIEELYTIGLLNVSVSF